MGIATAFNTVNLNSMRLAAVFSAALIAVPVQEASANTYSPPADTTAKMLSSLKTHRAAAIGVGVIRDGKLVWSGVYGEQAAGVAATSATMFNVASLAKPVSAALAMRLVADGRIGLDEVMSQTFIDPDLIDDARHEKLTLRFALSHQMGLPNWRNQRTDRTLAFINEPGRSFNYSGEGYEYLRRFIEKKTGQTFESLAATLVFTPLGMKHATFSQQAQFQPQLANPMNRAGEWKSPDIPQSGRGNAADNLFVTVEDYAAFMLATMKGEGLSAALASERLRPQVLMPPDRACRSHTINKPIEGCPDSAHFGLGWTLYQFGKTTTVVHTGSDWGEFAMVYFDPATRNGMLYFVNGGNGVPVLMDAMAWFDADAPMAGFGRAQMRAK